MNPERLSSDPDVLLLRDFISDAEARHLIGRANFVQSKVSCDKAGGCVSNMRTSATAYLPQDAVTTSIAERGMRFSGMRFAEDLQIVRYQAGQEFKPHLDAFDPKTFAGQQELAGYGGRQRDATLLIYLNRPAEGGATRFTELGIDVEPEPRAALFWRNVKDGRIDPRTRHAGLPVVSGVKYAVNLWIRGAKAIGRMPEPWVRNYSFPRTIGRLGEFRPSPEADGKQFNVKIDRRPYTGTKYTLEKMAAYVKDGSTSPAMRQFAEMVIRQAGVAASEKISNRRAGDILLGYVKSNVRYRPDPNNVEMVQEPHITLCVPGASMCIPVEDCDGLTVALGSLMGAYGIPVRIMKQTFSDDSDEEHVLIIFQTDDGKWLAADPSAPASVGVGFKASAASEVIIDPLDPGGTGTQVAEFVGIGSSITFEFSEMPVGLPPKRIQIGAGFVTPGDVLAYRTLWNDYVVAAANACQACSDAWAASVQGINTQQFQITPDATTMQLWANNQAQNSAEIMREWNLHASSPDWQIVAMADEILQDFQRTVLKVGQFYLPQVAKDCPNIALPAPPSASLQQEVIARVEGLGILLHGVLQILGIGAGGSLETVQGIVDNAKDAANKTFDAVPWIAGAVIAVASAYTIGKLVDVMPMLETTKKHVEKSASEARRLVRRRKTRRAA